MEAHIAELVVSDQLDVRLAIIRDVITERLVHLLETSHHFLFGDHWDSHATSIAVDRM